MKNKSSSYRSEVGIMLDICKSLMESGEANISNISRRVSINHVTAHKIIDEMVKRDMVGRSNRKEGEVYSVFGKGMRFISDMDGVEKIFQSYGFTDYSVAYSSKRYI